MREGGVLAGVGVLGQRHKLTVWGGADGQLKVVAKEGATLLGPPLTGSLP